MSCGSRLSYLDEIAWTWQDGRLLALCLCAIGLLGAFLNGLVLIGVGGNAKLGTTVNKLLIWICTIAILESFVGILVKALILAQVIQTTVNAKWNRIFCKIILALPFSFCNIILVFWSLISFYRLYLVKRAANRKSMKDERKRKHFNDCVDLSCAPDTFRPQTTLPLTGIFVGSSIGVFTAIFSDSFVLLRDCRGNCIDPDVKFEEWKTALAMLVSACTFHVPSSLCYLFIYFIVKRHQRDQKRARLARSVASSGAMAIRMTLLSSRKEAVQPATEMHRHALPENKDFEESENIEEFDSRTPSTPKETLKRKMSSPLVLIRKVSNNLMQTLQVPERNNVKRRRKSATSMETSDMFDPSSGRHDNDLDIEVDNSTYICHKEGKVPSFVKTKSLQKAPSQQQVIAGQNLPKLCCFGEGPTDKMVVTSDHFFAMPPSLTINGRSIEAQLHEDTQRKVDYYEEEGNDRVLTPSRRRRRKSVTSRRRHEEGGKYAISNGPPSSRKSSQCSNTVESRFSKLANFQAKRRRRRRNIISAKLSVVFILLSILMGLLLHFGYVKVDTLLGTKGDTITLRAFINALAFDVVLVIISPLMLLYSSKDLRKAIKTKFVKRRRRGQ